MRYSTDLTDTQWELIKEFFESKKGRHLIKHDKRELVNAVLYQQRTGCQWRLLPNDFPNHYAVWSFYQRARKPGRAWGKAMAKL